MRLKLLRLGLLAIVVLALVGAGLLAWNSYQRMRADYDDYRARIQPGIRIAGVEAGWLTPEEARERVQETVAPYFQDLRLDYEDEEFALSPAGDMGLAIPVDDLVDEAVAASHQYDYWDGFWLWLKGNIEHKDLEVPLRMSHDAAAAAREMAAVAEAYDEPATEPMVDMKRLTFIPGRPGRRLDVATAAGLVDAQVEKPGARQIVLPVTPVEPDHSPARIESMISALGPVMERAPGPPRFYTDTLPISTTGGIEGTPRITYTGELTWTFPQFFGYEGPLTTTYAYFFDPGEPGLTFNVQEAVSQVQAALAAGVTAPITFEPDWVPAPPMKASVLIEPLKARLARFPGFTAILIKNLDTGQVIYDSNTRYVLSGMSVVKIGIMLEVYRYFDGEVDAQTYQELRDMMGVESCNPCANRLMAILGGGSQQTGAQRVTAAMQRLGLANFRLCAPFQIVEAPEPDVQAVAGAMPGGLSWPARPSAFHQLASTNLDAVVLDKAPGYDRCVKATPAEMAYLLDMIYQGSQGKGALLKAYPKLKPDVYQDMIDIMAANDLRNMLGAGIPPEVKLAHKHGFAGYDVPWGDTRAEVGIVFSPQATYLVTFYIWQDIDWINFGINQPLYRDVSNMIYNFFNFDQPFWPRPPWVATE